MTPVKSCLLLSNFDLNLFEHHGKFTCQEQWRPNKTVGIKSGKLTERRRNSEAFKFSDNHLRDYFLNWIRLE